MIIDAISDLHGFYPELEGGDLLIVAGDLVKNGDYENEYALFDYWLNDQKYKKKVVIAGNHDNWLEKNGLDPYKTGMPYFQFCDYLCDSGTEFEYEEPVNFPFEPDNKSFVCRKKLKIWGSSWTKSFPGMNPHCKAFTLDTEEELAEKWKLIPKDVNILITHSPPYGILDLIDDQEHCGNYHAGSKTLSEVLDPDAGLRLHVFGHIHEGYGHYHEQNPVFEIHHVNASHVNEYYEPVNKPIRIIL